MTTAPFGLCFVLAADERGSVQTGDVAAKGRCTARRGECRATVRAWVKGGSHPRCRKDLRHDSSKVRPRARRRDKPAATRLRAGPAGDIRLLFTCQRTDALQPAGYLPGPGCSVIFFITSSRLKLAGFWRGGNSLKLLSHCAAAAWAGTRRNDRLACQSP